MKILIVDDHSYNRDILACILQDAGHECLEAVNGAEACEVFAANSHIEFVLMDVNMPVMDGFAATRSIRAMTEENLVTIIFVTALDNTEVTVKCLESGGDDFVPKPVNEDILLSKIAAHQRQQCTFNRLKAVNQELVYHQSLMDREHKIVEHVFAQGAKRNGTYCANVRHHSSSMSLFNGDLVLTAPSPAGGAYVLIGDFTGHGLSAAIGSLPVTEIFYDYAARQISVSQMAREINNRLRNLLPMGMFFCACILSVDASGKELFFWAGGMNDLACVLPGETSVVTLCGDHMPLGILEDYEFNDTSQLHNLAPGSKIYVYTDGINEAKNSQGEEFGHDAVYACLLENPNDAIEKITEAVKAFEGTSDQSDDFTLVEVTCCPVRHFALDTGELVDVGAKFRNVECFPWGLSAYLAADDLRRTDAVQQLLAFVGTIQGVELHQDKLFMIVSELYSNALEHGVLGLDSALKDTMEGFEEYYRLRETRLQEVDNHFIELRFQYLRSTPNQLRLTMTDSGKGFDVKSVKQDIVNNSERYGRGMSLLQSLCNELLYSNNGRTVTAVYHFS